MPGVKGRVLILDSLSFDHTFSTTQYGSIHRRESMERTVPSKLTVLHISTVSTLGTTAPTRHNTKTFRSPLAPPRKARCRWVGGARPPPLRRRSPPAAKVAIVGGGGRVRGEGGSGICATVERSGAHPVASFDSAKDRNHTRVEEACARVLACPFCPTITPPPLPKEGQTQRARGTVCRSCSAQDHYRVARPANGACPAVTSHRCPPAALPSWSSRGPGWGHIKHDVGHGP